jgi:hypothetical protein
VFNGCGGIRNNPRAVTLSSGAGPYLSTLWLSVNTTQEYVVTHNIAPVFAKKTR